MSDFQIRPLRLDEMAAPLAWAQREGWNPGLQDKMPFWHVDQAGFLGGYLDDELIATISAIRYDDTFGFIGFYIVEPQHRGQRYGLQMWQAGMAKLETVVCIGLDGVLEQQENYRQSGFVLAHKNARYEGSPQQNTAAMTLDKDERMLSTSDVSFDALTRFDTAHFPTNRASFLRAWTKQMGHRGRVILKSDQVCAYGVIRPCGSGYKIGPLFAQTTKQAYNLILALCASLEPGVLVYIDPPANNPQAITLIESLGMKMVFETARMYKGTAPELPLSAIFGITSFELG